ncbi:hypothetical protein [Nonomuraea lactucae]|uniref:hypothetical protein n=1 Tax=Nonomuraea lactucae TaxID=2249762 RepID=UPI0013B3D12C|nr:hypothetical protein [Nonomuraea lactucae]
MKRLMTLFLVCCVLSGCGDPVDPEAEQPGAPGVPSAKEDDGEGYGAPIKIPRRTEDQGRPLSVMKALIESGIRDQCPGHRLCVRLRVEARDVPGFSTCTFVATDPRQGSEVRRGSTVVIVTGEEPCTSTPTTDREDTATPDPGTPTPTVDEPPDTPSEDGPSRPDESPGQEASP